METEWGFLEPQLQGTYIQRQLARTNRNLFLIGLGLIVAVGSYGVSESRYFYNFFKGPAEMNAEAIATVMSPETLKRYFVSVKGDDSIDSGVQNVEKQVSQTGVVESETVKAGYSILTIGKRLLIVKRPPKDNGKEYAGALVDLPADVRSEIITPLLSDYPHAEQVFLPTMLDATGFRDEGYTAAAICTPLILFALWIIWKVRMRIENPLRHPILKSLSRYGSLADSARQIEAETNNTSLRKIVLSRSWILRPSVFALAACHVPDIVWAYEKVTKHSVNFIPTGKSYAAVIVDKYGRSLELAASKREADEFLETLCVAVPWAVFGFTDELQRIAEADWNGFVAAVNGRRLGS
jgi:hypothetical protein